MKNKKVFSAVKKCVMFFVIFGMSVLQLSNSGRAIEIVKPADAEWLIDSGENHIWYQIAEDTLTIGGAGEIPDYDSGEDTPWYNNKSSITRIIINDGITRIGNNSFRGDEDNKYISNIEEAILPTTLVSIGNYAFRYNGSLVVVAIKNPTPPTIGEGIFWDTNEGLAFVVPASARDTYLNSDWKVNEDTGEGCLFDFNTFSAYFVYIVNSDGGNVSSTLEYIPVDFYTPETVVLTTITNDGYSLKSLTVTTEDGTNITVENNSFVMPTQSVTVNAIFEKPETNPEIPNCPKTGIR